ncbi:DUF4238 domain-containing protein [Halorhabdus rudnickae]|uniref:DUF4238 domain-containing protein n=1 Tax=Halorhabdus rudnickae TaxID=1775544 RepID=UPI0010825A9B|nr:DUF4238 domain-containing protein [Halorhabdus rudnickae]
MRDEYKFQHYVPRMHLKKFFVSNSNSQVWVFDKPNERKFQSTLDNIGGENFFYDPAEFEDPEIESLLTKIEGKAGDPYKKLLSEGSLSTLTKKRKDADGAVFISTI